MGIYNPIEEVSRSVGMSPPDIPAGMPDQNLTRLNAEKLREGEVGAILMLYVASEQHISFHNHTHSCITLRQWRPC